MLKDWIKKLSKPTDLLGGFSVCPFAKEAKFTIISTNGSDINPDIQNLDLIIYVLPLDYNEEEIINIANHYNQIHKNLVFLPDPKNRYTEINGVQTNNGKYNLILCQDRKKLEKARSKLKRTTYYSFWDEEYLKEILNT